MITKIFKDLESINGSSFKLKILRDNSTNEVLKNMFYLANSKDTFGIRIDKPEYTGNFTIEDLNIEFNNLIKNLIERNITGNDARKKIYDFLCKLTSEDQDLLIRVINKSLILGVGFKTINKVWPNLLSEIKFQLANRFDETIHNTNDYYVSYKLDGIRGIFRDSIVTRNQKSVCGVISIEEECKYLVDKYKLDLIDGELYTKGSKFEKIMSIVNSKSLNKEGILFYVFAIKNEELKNTFDMLSLIEKINNNEDLKYIKFLKQEPFIGNLKEKLKDAELNGYEGLMLRHKDIYYDDNRSDYLLKVKSWNESDFKVVELREGRGKYKNNLGSLIVEGTIDNKFIRCNVGTGLKDDIRYEIWEDKENTIGRTVEVKYFEVTKSGNEYSLRFPVFYRFKD